MLAQYLLEYGIKIVGTVQSNRQNFPCDFASWNLTGLWHMSISSWPVRWEGLLPRLSYKVRLLSVGLEDGLTIKCQQLHHNNMNNDGPNNKRFILFQYQEVQKLQNMHNMKVNYNVIITTAIYARLPTVNKIEVVSI